MSKTPILRSVKASRTSAERDEFSARPVEASDETRLDRIDGAVEDHRNCSGCGFGHECRIRGARGDDDDSAADQIGR